MSTSLRETHEEKLARCRAWYKMDKERNPEKYQAQSKRKWLRHRDKILAANKMRREKNIEQWKAYQNDRMNLLRFGGNKYLVMKRDNFQCQDCGATEKLIPHHIDGKGYGHLNPNHHPENLITLCVQCHGKRHAEFRKLAINKKGR